MIKDQVGSPSKVNGYEMVNLDLDEENDESKLSPLLHAAKNGDLVALNLCLEKGDDILQVDDGQSTALHYVSYQENFETAIDCAETLLLWAKKNSNKTSLQNLLNAENISKRTALGNAALRGNHKLIQILLDEGATLNVTKANKTLFHIIAKSKNSETSLECVKILLNLKYYENNEAKLREYLNIEDRYTKRTALHFAGIFGHHEIIEELIRNGADATTEDFVNCNIFHHAVGNAFEEKAVLCTETLLKDLSDDWSKIFPSLLESMDKEGRCPVHIGARRGFHKILGLLNKYYALQEAGTGLTALHSAASLGDEDQAELCVKEILSHGDEQCKRELCNAQDAEGRTPLYLSAKERNVQAAKLLLLAGSGFDIKSKRGKTPLEKVYEKIPQAVCVLLDESIKNSGYVAYFRTINTVAEIDFGPILGYSTSKSNVYKETEELAKVCKAKFADRKSVLYHPFVQIYIHQKWEKVKWFFHIFRIFHILWFFLNCLFVVWTYRYVCPLPGAKNFSWNGLRPEENGETINPNENKTLSECKIPAGLRASGILNLFTLLIYILCQLHETTQKFHQIFRPAKINPKQNCVFKIAISISYNLRLTAAILPCGPIIIGFGILFSTLPTIGVQPFSDFCHYFIAGMVALGVWAAICLEAMKIPRFSFYKNLLWRSAKTLLVAITVTAPILFGFAALFAILIPAEPAFSSPAQSLVKVITFMIGELDYGSLVYGETESVFLGWVMLFMALFVVIIVVLLVNFLIGLAAEEISDVWDRAVIWSLCTKLEEIYALESLLDENIPICGRGFLRKNLMLMPPETEDGRILKQMRRARIKIPNLPKELQKEFHQLRLKTILEVKQL